MCSSGRGQFEGWLGRKHPVQLLDRTRLRPPGATPEGRLGVLLLGPTRPSRGVGGLGGVGGLLGPGTLGRSPKRIGLVSSGEQLSDPRTIPEDCQRREARLNGHRARTVVRFQLSENLNFLQIT